MINLGKEKLEELENIFTDLKNGENKIDELTNILNNAYDKKFSIHIVPVTENSKPFVLSITPEMSLIKDFTKSVASDDITLDVMNKKWSNCHNWRIDIDKRILNSQMNEKELVSLLIHELNHGINSDSTPKKISEVVRVGYANSDTKTKSLLKDKTFGRILSLPVVNACFYGNNKSSMKDELKSDKFIIDNGYFDTLTSAMDKIKDELNDSTQSSMNFALNSMNALKDGKSHLIKKNLHDLSKTLPDNILKECVNELKESMFDDFSENTYTEKTIYKNMDEHAATILNDCYMNEFLDIGKKKLKMITQTEVDYVLVKAEDIKTIDDKIMLLSYINSKLDMIDYYLFIINDPRMRKKYIIQNSEGQLLRFKTTLSQVKKEILNYKIKDKYQTLNLTLNGSYGIQYPTGYEG